MISQTIARRYAKALLAIGQEDQNFARYGEELAGFAKAQNTSGLAEALSNPIVPLENRTNILKAVQDKMQLSPMVKNVLSLMMEKGRINLVPSMNDYYQKLVDEVNNIARATIVTATAVDDDIKEQIQKTLEEMTSKKVIIEAVEDPEIIGGIVAKVGDLTLDGSVKMQLKNLKESLIKG